ncbi:MAG TPA: site-specific DNA-methyltransferase [Herpetosiphonaceae bacterium]
MGRGAFEHNYQSFDLPELRTQHRDVEPTPLPLVWQASPGAVHADLFCGDNLALGNWLLARGAAFRLIYLDPPFASGKRYAARVNGAKGVQSQAIHAYDDDDDLEAYLRWLELRLVVARDLLAHDGTLYVHLDWHAVHYVKVLLDRLFGRSRFLNEIIWCYHGPSPITSAFKRKHDTILVYTKSRAYYFNADAVRTPYDESTVRTFRSSRKAGFGKVPDLERGKVPEDWWYFPVVARLHGERVGYETQKPEALLRRVILASSAPGDAILDLFGGSGTTGVVGAQLGRHTTLCDSNPVAIEKTLLRLRGLDPCPDVRVWRYSTVATPPSQLTGDE